MHLCDLLGRNFTTTDGKFVAFTLTGYNLDKRIVRLTPFGALTSQRVPIDVFFAALHMGAMVEIEG
jgi:hypothetical protein